MCSLKNLFEIDTRLMQFNVKIAINMNNFEMLFSFERK